MDQDQSKTSEIDKLKEQIAMDRVEIGRLRGVIVGCEVAIARDGWPEGAMRLIRQEREAHGY